MTKALIPYKKKNAKSRLSPALTLEERESFVELMLRDVVTSIQDAEIEEIDILTTPDNGVPKDLQVNVVLDENDLNEAINEYLSHEKEPIFIIMADLPLVRAEHIKDITSRPEDVVIVPGKGGGTNVIFVKDPSNFHVKYYGSSFLNHCNIAKDRECSTYIYDSFLLSTDIDEPHDLVEIMLHGHGRSKEYVLERFDMETGKTRAKISSSDA
ncbi:2-phospho-L-lactate guanylyltransferase [Methanolobus profundi]|uniref:2-phospho-L-lactate guanylyltransferase n=1 Tax=Methanolobus profundi TaxID=487685 RepID=A0A1I4NIB5_9EURY|nr:2-phospho-L-lactate guanylyltransferase [Methanolobus profundi]SFM15090.1 phospholactate guanylyltransferase [Methanolobus profundi]